MEGEGSKSFPKTSYIADYTKRNRFKSESDYAIKKRVPPREERRPNEFYVTNKSDFKGQLAQCFKLFDKGESEVILHGLGAAVPRAVNLALQIEEKLVGLCELDVQTRTVSLVDDFEPLNDSLDPFSNTRNNSAITIKVIKRSPSCSSP